MENRTNHPLVLSSLGQRTEKLSSVHLGCVQTQRKIPNGEVCLSEDCRKKKYLPPIVSRFRNFFTHLV